MAKKKLVSTKASKTTTKVSKKQNNTSSEDKNSSVKVKEQRDELNISAQKEEKGNVNSKKSAAKILQVKWIIVGSLLLIVLAILYYVQTNQIKKTERTQDLKIEAQLEKFQTSLADKLVKNQNDKIEEVFYSNVNAFFENPTSNIFSIKFTYYLDYLNLVSKRK